MDIPVWLWIAVLGGAAVVVAAVVAGPWGWARRRVALVVGAWAAVDLVLGAAGVFAAGRHRAVPILAFGLVVPLAIGLWFLLRPGTARELVDTLPVRWLVGVQAYRAIGAVFVAAWAIGRMPWQFALPAGIGDVAVGLGAPLVAAATQEGRRGARRAAIVWNVAGLVDLVVAVTLGFLTSPSPLQQLATAHPNGPISRLPFVLVPTFAVPLSVLLHVAALRRLRAEQSALVLDLPRVVEGVPGEAAGGVAGRPRLGVSGWRARGVA